MAKILKESAIMAGVIFMFNLIIKLVINPDRIVRTFDRGVGMGLGVFFTSFVLLFLVICIILTISRWIARRKSS
ncbi:hypothetical protein CHH67_06780 [Paenibacillus campinasensis]|uniref:Uncharacterized protein n=1 Tax=Paenibacillus campinasensis TaxID=66347 RepID=A0A268EZC1_9BACL|nr:hypothetical protein CHH67_06780 [Paenibacillus campinasensis]